MREYGCGEWLGLGLRAADGTTRQGLAQMLQGGTEGGGMLPVSEEQCDTGIFCLACIAKPGEALPACLVACCAGARDSCTPSQRNKEVAALGQEKG